MAKRPKVAFKYGRKFCIFCGAPADSEEHILPKWAKHILPKSAMHRRFSATGRRSLGPKGFNVQKLFHRQGSPATIRIKRVCQPCNTGWMSRCEEGIRQHLERMILGERTFLIAATRLKLAQYLSYKMLLLDWLEDDPALPPEYASGFYKTGEIPPGVHIWGFHCFEGRWQTDVETIGVGLAEPERAGPDLPVNTKSFSVGFGSFFVFGIISAERDLEFKAATPGAVALWPLDDELVVWPPRWPINSTQATAVSRFLHDFKGSS
jgi:hypothetical protein